MKKHIVLSVNDNPTYLFYVPLVCWAWRVIGWEPIVFVHNDQNNSNALMFIEGINELAETSFYYLNNVGDYKSETITQVSRLYGTCVADGYLMTSDVDMIPLSSYWNPDPNQLTVYGRDLTDYHYPICYIGAPSKIWSEIMTLNHDDYNSYIKRDLDDHFDKNASKEKQWVFDQDLITARINESTIYPIRIDRGTDKRTNYPIGRVDRSHWTLDHKQYIDCHLPHDILTNEASFKKVMELLHNVWPKEDFKWMVNYYKEFKKLCHNTQFAV